MKTAARKLQLLITTVAGAIEMVLSGLILIAVLLASFALIADMITHTPLSMTPGEFDTLLGRVMSIVIGIEFIKMLVKRSPSAIIEVLLFAIARQLIVSHTGTLEALFAIFSVAILFFVRKYLFIQSLHDAETREESIS